MADLPRRADASSASSRLVLHIHRRFPTNVAPERGNDGKSVIVALAIQPYALTLLFISMTGALAGLLIDVQFYRPPRAPAWARKATPTSSPIFTSCSISARSLQLFATPKIQDKIGMRGGLMVLPFALVGGAAFAARRPPLSAYRCCASPKAACARLYTDRSGSKRLFRSTRRRSIHGQTHRRRRRRAHRRGDRRASDSVLAQASRARLDKLEMPLDTRWMSWALRATVASFAMHHVMDAASRVKRRKGPKRTSTTREPRVREVSRSMLHARQSSAKASRELYAQLSCRARI